MFFNNLYNIYNMKEYILLAINLAFTIGLFIYIYDPKQDYIVVPAPYVCMNFKSKSLCAQCITRSQFISPSKGYLINSTTEYSGLKFPHKQEYISCKESLHLVDYSDVNAVSIRFEKQQIIGQLLSELDASVIFAKKGKSVIEPKYESFIIFGWYGDIQKKGVDVFMPNENINQSVLAFFFKILNVFVLILIVGKLLTSKQQHKNENQVSNFLIFLLVAGLQILTSSYYQQKSHLILYFIRIIALTIPVIKVQVRKTYVIAYILLGLLMILNPLTLAVHSYMGWLLILIGGWDKLSVQPIWRYVMVSQLIISVNYLVWYLVYEYEADSASRIIELSQLIVNLLAFTLLTNKRVQKFREYIPSDQKPIYLSGYDEQQEMVVRT